MRPRIDGDRNVLESAVHRQSMQVRHRAPHARIERTVAQHHPFHLVGARAQRTCTRDRNDLPDRGGAARTGLVTVEEPGVGVTEGFRELRAGGPELVLVELLLPRHREVVLDQLALVIPRGRIEHVDRLVKPFELERINVQHGLEPAGDLQERFDAVVRRQSGHERPYMLRVGKRVIGLATNDPLQHGALGSFRRRDSNLRRRLAASGAHTGTLPAILARDAAPSPRETEFV